MCSRNDFSIHRPPKSGEAAVDARVGKVAQTYMLPSPSPRQSTERALFDGALPRFPDTKDRDDTACRGLFEVSYQSC